MIYVDLYKGHKGSKALKNNLKIMNLKRGCCQNDVARMVYVYTFICVPTENHKYSSAGEITFYSVTRYSYFYDFISNMACGALQIR